MSYIVYFILLAIIPLIAQSKVRSAYNKYSRVMSSRGMTGAEVARRILDENGLTNVTVHEVNGHLSDHYDPRKKSVRLSSEIYHGRSLASVAISAHECGHAIQDSESYFFLKMRSALVPLATLGSNLSWVLIMIGIFLTAANFILFGIIFMAFAVLFQIVTLPVEFNASSRAMDQVVAMGIINNNEERETKKVLSAAAMTYVAAAAVALIELLRFVLMFVGMNRSDD